MDGRRNLLLMAGNMVRVTITDSGQIGFGKTPSSSFDVTGAPTTNFDVAGYMHADGLTLGNSRKAITYVSGSNIACLPPSTGEFLLRKWSARTCGGTSSSSPCTTSAGWNGNAPSCEYSLTSSTKAICTANAWTEAFCF